MTTQTLLTSDTIISKNPFENGRYHVNPNFKLVNHLNVSLPPSLLDFCLAYKKAYKLTWSEFSDKVYMSRTYCYAFAKRELNRKLIHDLAYYTNVSFSDLMDIHNRYMMAYEIDVYNRKGKLNGNGQGGYDD